MNTIFVCRRCQHLDHVDLAEGYYRLHQQAEEAAGHRGLPYEPFVCTQCLTGSWHQQFEYRPYDPMVDRDIVCNPPIPS